LIKHAGESSLLESQANVIIREQRSANSDRSSDAEARKGAFDAALFACLSTHPVTELDIGT
jgi:hypothetical protein